MKSHRGTLYLSTIWLIYLFSFSLLMTAFFVGQRIKAIRKMERTQRDLHSLHKENFKGKRSWWPQIAQPQKRNRPQTGLQLTQIKKPKNQKISIDFGR